MKARVAPPIDAALHERWEPVYRSRLHYLVSWSTRGRKPVLRQRHALKVNELVTKICEERGYELLDVAVGQDHVHALFGLKPSQSVATAVRELKSRSGLGLMSDYPELRVWLGGHLLWDERYAVETVSPIRLERIQRKLRHLHGPPETLAEAG